MWGRCFPKVVKEAASICVLEYDGPESILLKSTVAREEVLRRPLVVSGGCAVVLKLTIELYLVAKCGSQSMWWEDLDYDKVALGLGNGEGE